MALEKLVKKVNKYSTRLGQAYAVILAFQATADMASLSINELMPKDGQTIVFTSGNDEVIPLPYAVTARIIDFFMYAPITLRQNLHGNKVKWVSNATKREVLDGLSDPKYQNVAFIGHGTSFSFWAADGPVYPEDVLDLPKKSGELIQHTCGSGSPELRDALLIDPQKGYWFDEPISVGKNYATAWKQAIISFYK